VYTERKFLQGTNNNMQLKKVIDNHEVLIMTNISVIKNTLTATYSKYRVSEDFSTFTPLFLDVD
jgi:hypothetical protein